MENWLNMIEARRKNKGADDYPLENLTLEEYEIWVNMDSPSDGIFLRVMNSIKKDCRLKRLLSIFKSPRLNSYSSTS